MRLIPLFSVLTSTVHAALKYRANDWSSTILEEAAGKSWKNFAGVKQPLETIMKNAGINLAVARLWIDPTDGGNYGLDEHMALAKRANAAGLKIACSMHLSPTWTNPNSQDTPTAWQGLSLEKLGKEVYNYCGNVMNTYQSHGIPLEIAYMGNEIGKGVLFPVGKVTSGNYYNLAYLLQSCSAGIKASKIAIKPKIAIHLSSGANVGSQTGWYDGVLAAGPFKSTDYDMQAISYYPCWGTQATLAKFKSTIATMYSKYNKEIIVAETNWPQECPDTTKYPFPSDTKSIPFSVSGQKEWLANIGSIVSAQSGGVGITYWEGGWINNAGLGTECTNMLLVDSSGKDLGGFGAIGKL